MHVLGAGDDGGSPVFTLSAYVEVVRCFARGVARL